MSTKKKRRTGEVIAKKRRRGLKLFLLSALAAVVVGFFAFLGISMYDLFHVTDEKESVSVKKEKYEVILFFSDNAELVLVPEKRWIARETSVEAQSEELVKALINGPGAGSNSELIRTFPEGAQLNKVKIDKSGLAWVDFDKTLVDLHPGGTSSEVATVYSLTNTLIRNISAVKMVQITIDGEIPETLKGHVDTRYPFIFNKDLIKGGSVPE
jgi:hypothetical protein